MQRLTERQRMILDYITEHIRTYLYPPTIREIAKHMEIGSTNGVVDHLRALRRKGWVRTNEMKSRGIILTEKTCDDYGLKFSDPSTVKLVKILANVIALESKDIDLSTSSNAEQGADTALRAIHKIIKKGFKTSEDTMKGKPDEKLQ